MRKVYLYTPEETLLYQKMRSSFLPLFEQEEVIELKPGSGFSDPRCINLRSGDLFILYASTPADLTNLSKYSSDFSDYRIILIAENTIPDPYRAGLALHPRFTVLADSDLFELVHVINRIRRRMKVNRMQRRNTNRIVRPISKYSVLSKFTRTLEH